LRESSAGAIGTGFPKTPLLPRLQVTDSVARDFRLLDAHKELTRHAKVRWQNEFSGSCGTVLRKVPALLLSGEEVLRQQA
jgi:hypothetical protein